MVVFNAHPRLDPYLERLVDLKGSDMYLTVGYAPSVRVEERIIPLSQAPLNDGDVEELLGEILNEEKRDEFNSTMELNMPMAWRDLKRFRINIFRQQQPFLRLMY